MPAPTFRPFLFVLCLALAALVLRADAAPLRQRSPLHPRPPLPKRGISALLPAVGSSTVKLGDGSYPRTVRLTDGTIMAVITGFEGDGTQTLNILKSTDNGNNFSPYSVVATTHHGNDFDNGQLVQLPAKTTLGGHRILATFRNHTRSHGEYTFYRIGVCHSDDLGKSWGGCVNVAARPAEGVNGLWEPFLWVTTKGNVQIYYASEFDDWNQRIMQQTSTDGGVTWSKQPKFVSTGPGRDGMPGVASYIDLRDGQQKLFCVFENTLNPKAMRQGFHVFSSTSADDGQTWENRSIVYSALGDDNNAGSPQVATTTLNELVVSFMTDEDTQEHNWVSGANMKVVVSNVPSPVQDGFVWGGKVTVFGVQANWPGLMTMGDGSILGAATFNNVAQTRRLDFVPGEIGPGPHPPGSPSPPGAPGP